MTFKKNIPTHLNTLTNYHLQEIKDLNLIITIYYTISDTHSTMFLQIITNTPSRRNLKHDTYIFTTFKSNGDNFALLKNVHTNDFNHK